MSIAQLFYRGLSASLILIFTLSVSSNINAQCTTCSEEQVVISYEADNTSPGIGDQICYTVRVDNFQSQVTFIMSINFSSSSLRLQDDINTNISGLPSFTASSIFKPTAATGLDIIRVLWSAPGSGPFCLDDNSILMELCFDVIGNPGDPILFDINNAGLNGIPIEFISEDSTGMQCPVSTMPPMAGPVDSTSVPSSVLPNCTGIPQLFRRSICGTQAGFSDGLAELNVLCGESPYTVNINNGDSFTTMDSVIIIDSLPEGSYIITVTDANGVTSDPFDIDIDQSTPLEVEARLRYPRCPSHTGGSIVLTVTGGQPYASGEYRYNWNNQIFGIGVNDNVSLGNGVYPVAIQDSIGCTVREEFVFDTQDPEPAVTNIINPFCERRNNGLIVVEGRGGTPYDGVGYNFFLTGVTNDGVSVDNSNVNTDTLRGWSFSNIAPGSYVIGIEDSLQKRGGVACPLIFTDTLIIDYSRDYSLNITGGDVSGCTGDGRATIDIATTNPPSNFDFEIFDDSGASVQTGSSSTTTFNSDCLASGMYSITIDDGQGCTTDTTFNIVACNLSIIPVQEPIFCTGETGVITLNASSDSLPITYIWSNGDSTDRIENLEPGTYSVTITDGANCSIMEDFIVDPPELISISFSSIDPACPMDLGSITATAIGGFDPYVYTWDPDTSMTSGETLSNIPGGMYRVTVTDDDGCTAIDSFVLSSNTPPTASISNITVPRCEGDPSGAAVVSVIPNADFPGPFDFVASTGTMGSGTNFSASNFISGTNWVVYTDQATGCLFDTVFVEIPVSMALSIDDDLSFIGTVDCFGGEGTIDGANVNLVAEQPGVTFTWPDGDETAVRVGLSAGTYIVTLTAETCISTDTVIVTQPDSLEVFVDESLSVFPSCGGDGASIVIGTTGGAPGMFSYAWANLDGVIVSTDTFANNLPFGEYSITVTDGNGCVSVLPLTVDVAIPVVATIDPIIQPACFGEEGIISINSASGGAGGYRYQVNTAPAQDITEPFSAQPGDYTIRVFDEEGCSFDTMVTIITPSDLMVSAGPDQEIELGSSVILSSNISSDIAIDSVIWTASDELTCANATCSEISVSPTTDQIYTIEVIDANGCSAFDEVLVRVVRSLNVFIPNIFSPESANPLNRTLSIFTGAGVQVIESFKIYDRWGNLVHIEENMPPQANGAGSWDGSLNGRDLDPGVFVYVVQLRFDGEAEPVIRKGDITLIR